VLFGRKLMCLTPFHPFFVLVEGSAGCEKTVWASGLFHSLAYPSFFGADGHGCGTSFTFSSTAFSMLILILSSHLPLPWRGRDGS